MSYTATITIQAENGVTVTFPAALTVQHAEGPHDPISVGAPHEWRHRNFPDGPKLRIQGFSTGPVTINLPTTTIDIPAS